MHTDNPSQVARAALELRELLLRGKFRPGERLREVPLASQLGVSRIPLRLALERLGHEGLLEVRPTRGFVVPRFSLTDIYDAIELRGVLEGTAARLSSERLREAGEVQLMRTQSHAMAKLLRRRKLTLDYLAQYAELNQAFHTELLRLSRSRTLRRAMEQACSLPFSSPSAFLRRQHIDPEARDLFLIAVDQHQEIVDAIANREGMRAETLAREHARLARRNLDLALRTGSTKGDLLKLVPGGKLIQLP